MSTAAPDAAPGSTQHAAPNAAGPHQDPHPVRTFVTTALVRMFPPITWVPKYKPAESLLKDVAGGVVMGVMFIPMGLGYASLLNIPLQVGLWSACIYSGLYAFFGNTGVLSMGPVAEITLMLMGTSGLGDDPETRASTIQVISFEVGILSLGLCLVMGGTIIRNSFARAVGNAYAAAAGIILIVVQMKDALNIKGTSTVLLHEAIQVIITGLQNTNGYNTAYCFIMFLLMFMYLQTVKHFKQIPSWVPHQLFVVVVAILVTWLARLDQQINLNIVKTVKSDWPLAQAPDTSKMSSTIVSGVVITLVSFLQMYSIATRFSDDVHANQELFANGICAFVAGFLGMIPGSSSFSRSAVLTDIGAKSPLNSLVSALVVFVSVVGLTRAGVFYYLPKVALAAIIVAGVSKLVDFTHAKWLFKYFKIDFCVWLTVFLLTLFMGVAWGILSGIALSILIVLFRVGVPRTTTLGYDAARGCWAELEDDDELLLHREVHVWSFDSPLYFINVSYFTPKLEESLAIEGRPIRVIVVNCSGITSIDASSVEGFVEQIRTVQTRKAVTVLFAGLKPSVKVALLQFPELGFPFPVYPSIDAAVQAAGVLVMNAQQLLAPHRPVPACVLRDGPAVAVLDSAVAIVAVVAPADRSPKQKLKLPLSKHLLGCDLLQLREIVGKVRIVHGSLQQMELSSALRMWPRNDRANRASAAVLADLLDAGRDELSIEIKGATLIAKWGGTITEIGVAQAEACGVALASRLGLDAKAEQRRKVRERATGSVWTWIGQATHLLPSSSGGSERRVSIAGTTNGDKRCDKTGKAFGTAFARASTRDEGALVDLQVDAKLDVVSHEDKHCHDRSMKAVADALHANAPHAVDVILHHPGIRGVIEVLGQLSSRSADDSAIAGAELAVAATVTIPTATPYAALTRVAELTSALITKVQAACVSSPPVEATSPGGFLEDYDATVSASMSPLAAVAPMVGSEADMMPPTELSKASNNDTFADGERPEDLARRYSIVLQQLAPHTAKADADGPMGSGSEGSESNVEGDGVVMHGLNRFNVGKITALYDNATYDVIHNAKVLERRCGYDMRPLLALLQPLYVAVTSGRFGVTSSERLVGGALHGIALLQRLRQTLIDHAWHAAEKDRVAKAQREQAAAAGLEEDKHSPAEPEWTELPVDMIFTSASLITALRNCMAFSSVMRTSANAHAQAALLQEETGWHYMAHVVFVLTKSTETTAEPVEDATTPGGEPVEGLLRTRSVASTDGYLIDIFLSTGASLPTDAATELARTERPSPGIPAASPNLVEVSQPVDDTNPLQSPARLARHDDDEGVDIHERRTQQAAGKLKHVSPMHRVWRLSLAQLDNILTEMDGIRLHLAAALAAGDSTA